VARNSEKERLDQLLVQRQLAPSRQKAQAYILTGNVLVDDEPVDKPGTRVAVDAAVRIRGAMSKYVGRGGDKIEGALTHFGVELDQLVALDVGASTGGFTDCLLQHGVSRVYAVDVGTNQLDHRLRIDSRVVVMEKTHAKELPSLLFEPAPTLAVIDVSFISLRKILESVIAALKKPFTVVALVKPQFELEPEFVSKGGVVREEAYQQRAVQLVKERGESLGLVYYGDIPSPLKGEKKGNQEYFVCFRNE